ncbi:hypothetical protein CAOG_04862 [Capsaspora owczarzaki ATCC 30864]|uniref:hypothetical protein n=1 Tax=Capsaspora owczarzaki (strain ATCC 30864) TaxID=595528 RepID=UPI0003524F06|nr:hypothetical protein CAOG_04862 [Capsaspora owczarzaki ATCC 30864]|eukprot:XP_004347613.2 hypothetical protein CAOG_04862 [Capsaspora owczarzaki ATCC 30864]
MIIWMPSDAVNTPITTSPSTDAAETAMTTRPAACQPKCADNHDATVILLQAPPPTSARPPTSSATEGSSNSSMSGACPSPGHDDDATAVPSTLFMSILSATKSKIGVSNASNTPLAKPPSPPPSDAATSTTTTSSSFMASFVSSMASPASAPPASQDTVVPQVAPAPRSAQQIVVLQHAQLVTSPTPQKPSVKAAMPQPPPRMSKIVARQNSLPAPAMHQKLAGSGERRSLDDSDTTFARQQASSIQVQALPSHQRAVPLHHHRSLSDGDTHPSGEDNNDDDDDADDASAQASNFTHHRHGGRAHLHYRHSLTDAYENDADNDGEDDGDDNDDDMDGDQFHDSHELLQVEEEHVDAHMSAAFFARFSEEDCKAMDEESSDVVDKDGLDLPLHAPSPTRFAKPRRSSIRSPPLSIHSSNSSLAASITSMDEQAAAGVPSASLRRRVSFSEQFTSVGKAHSSTVYDRRTDVVVPTDPDEVEEIAQWLTDFKYNHMAVHPMSLGNNSYPRVHLLYQ